MKNKDEFSDVGFKKPKNFSEDFYRPSTYIVPEQHKDNPWATGIIDSACVVAAVFAVAAGYVHKDQIRSVLPDLSGLWRSARSSASIVASKVSLPKVSVSSSAVKQGAVCTTATCAGGAAGWFLRGSQEKPKHDNGIVILKDSDSQTIQEIIAQLPLTPEGLAADRELIVSNFPEARKKVVGFVQNLVQELHRNHATISRLEEQKNEIAGQRNAVQEDRDRQRDAKIKAVKALVLLAGHVANAATSGNAQASLEMYSEGNSEKVDAHGIRYMGVLLQNHETEKSRLLGAYDALTSERDALKKSLHHVVEEKGAVVLELDRQRLQVKLAKKGLKDVAQRVAHIMVPADKVDAVCKHIEDRIHYEAVSYEAQNL